MKTIRRTLLVAASVGLVVAGLAGCATNENSDKTANDKSASQSQDQKSDKGGEEEKGALAVNSRPDECGLQEQSGPEASVGPFDIALHYFQPAVMLENPNSTMKMVPYEKAQMHLELDTKANVYGTNWGYAADETPANLPIMYQIKDKAGKVLSKGMMMEMAAIDGSHYGLNLPANTIPGPGDYTLTVTIYPPLNYDIHHDYITGVPAESWWKPLTVNMDWKIEQKNLDTIKKNTVKDPMAVPENCTKYPKKMYKDAAAEKAMKEAEANAPLPMMHMDHDHMHMGH